jgi:flagellar hook-associated protein 2
MVIDSEYIQSMSTQLATFEVQGGLNRLNRNEANYKNQLGALSSLRSALTSFSSTVKSLNSSTSSMLINKASFSQEGYASATVGTSALAGRYQFHVERLASAHQIALEGLADGDLGTGKLIISQGDKPAFEIDLSEVGSTLEGLAAAINGKADNSGVKASLVRADGQTLLVLSSEESGLENAISLSTTSDSDVFSAAVGSVRELSAAQDAEVYLGGNVGGIRLTSSSNRFDNVIDGVSLTFSKAHAGGEAPLTIDIGRDESATRGKAQSFVDAFNTLMGSLGGLTASGSESSARGPLAGDASTRSIESRLKQLLRTDFAGVNLVSFGILADRNGKLTIDTARFEKAVAANPEGFDKLFTEKGSLLDTIDKSLASYTSSANGILKNRMDSLNLGLKRVNEQFETLQRQYDSYYARYLSQFTSMMQTMQAMEQTFGMFG